MADGEIQVGSVKLLENRSPIEDRQSALKAGQAYRPRKMAFVLVDLGRGRERHQGDGPAADVRHQHERRLAPPVLRRGLVRPAGPWAATSSGR
jgi:hypothetical protein